MEKVYYRGTITLKNNYVSMSNPRRRTKRWVSEWWNVERSQTIWATQMRSIKKQRIHMEKVVYRGAIALKNNYVSMSMPPRRTERWVSDWYNVEP